MYRKCYILYFLNNKDFTKTWFEFIVKLYHFAILAYIFFESKFFYNLDLHTEHLMNGKSSQLNVVKKHQPKFQENLIFVKVHLARFQNYFLKEVKSICSNLS